VFTPKHRSWLDLVESFFGKLAKTLLRGHPRALETRVVGRIELIVQEVNQELIVLKWN